MGTMPLPKTHIYREDDVFNMWIGPQATVKKERSR